MPSAVLPDYFCLRSEYITLRNRSVTINLDIQENWGLHATVNSDKFRGWLNQWTNNFESLSILQIIAGYDGLVWSFRQFLNSYVIKSCAKTYYKFLFSSVRLIVVEQINVYFIQNLGTKTFLVFFSYNQTCNKTIILRTK